MSWRTYTASGIEGQSASTPYCAWHITMIRCLRTTIDWLVIWNLHSNTFAYLVRFQFPHTLQDLEDSEMGGQKASEIAYAFTASHSLPTSDQSGWHWIKVANRHGSSMWIWRSSLQRFRGIRVCRRRRMTGLPDCNDYVVISEEPLSWYKMHWQRSNVLMVMSDTVLMW